MKSWTEVCIQLARLRGVITLARSAWYHAIIKGYKSYSWRSAPMLVFKRVH